MMTLKEVAVSDSVSRAVELLNDLLERDPKAITELINMRADCKETLAAHPTVQVQKFGDVHRIGVLGLLNGALGGGPSGDIGAKGTVDPQTGKIAQVRKFVDLRKDRTDVLA